MFSLEYDHRIESTRHSSRYRQRTNLARKDKMMKTAPAAATGQSTTATQGHILKRRESSHSPPYRPKYQQRNDMQLSGRDSGAFVLKCFGRCGLHPQRPWTPPFWSGKRNPIQASTTGISWVPIEDGWVFARYHFNVSPPRLLIDYGSPPWFESIWMCFIFPKCVRHCCFGTAMIFCLWFVFFGIFYIGWPKQFLHFCPGHF